MLKPDKSLAALKRAEDRLLAGLVEEDKFANESQPAEDDEVKQGDFYPVGKAYANNGSMVMTAMRMSMNVEGEQGEVPDAVMGRSASRRGPVRELELEPRSKSISRSRSREERRSNRRRAW